MGDDPPQRASRECIPPARGCPLGCPQRVRHPWPRTTRIPRLPGMTSVRASPKCIPRTQPRWHPYWGGGVVSLVDLLVFLLILLVNLLIIIEWIACKLLTVFLYSSMLLFKHACVFLSRFLLSGNYKIQIVARVGRKSAVVLSGTMEASYPHFFIGIDFDRFSRIHFPPLRSNGGKSILEKTVRRSTRTSRMPRESGKEKGPGGPR